jgi:hypothetical protein
MLSGEMSTMWQDSSRKVRVMSLVWQDSSESVLSTVTQIPSRKVSCVHGVKRFLWKVSVMSLVWQDSSESVIVMSLVWQDSSGSVLSTVKQIPSGKVCYVERFLLVR